MESIYYNTEDKEVSIVLGYGIVNHLSLKFLQDVVNSIKDLFPLLTVEQMMELKFMECSHSSRRHKYMWYTTFPYDLSQNEVDRWKSPILKKYTDQIHMTAYPVSSHIKGENGWEHESETAKQIILRLIHD